MLLLTLNRPERLNAWTDAMEDRYFGFLDEASTDPEVRAIVVTGSGRGFCPGADMENLQKIGETGAISGRPRRPQMFPLTIPKPVIAAINGPCAGLGMVQALMCDVRFAAEGAKLTAAFVRRGLVAEHGMSWLLPRLVGHGTALDLLLSGRVVLAEEAVSMGLVNRVLPAHELLPGALAYAGEMAAMCSPAAMAAIKAQVYSHLSTDLPVAMQETNRLMAESLRWPDFREGVASFVEHRAPRFPPLRAPSGAD